MLQLLANPQTLLYAILGGAIPAVFWLWFWLREEDPEETEPRGLIFLTFLLGSIAVLFAIWMEKASVNYVSDHTYQIVVWASIEEMLKMVGASIIILTCNCVDEPIDYPMYFIAAALGFAALENILYLLQPLSVSGTLVGIFTGNLRYLGSTLLHLIASGMIGSALGLSFYIKQFRLLYLIFGFACAVTLHSIFNFFIMKGSGDNFLSVFGFLWVIAIINILIYEKLKRMGHEYTASS